MIDLAVTFFRDKEGKILLQFRDSGAPSCPLLFSLFGGRMEEGETSDQSLLREVKEELGLDLKIEQFKLLTETPWTGVESGQEKTIYLYEFTEPIDWSWVDVHEGAGAAFFTKEEIAEADCISQFAKHLVGKYA